MIGKPIDACTGLFSVDLDEFRIRALMREPHHVFEEGFRRVFGVIFLKAAPNGSNPAGRINGGAVGTVHLFQKDCFCASFGSFKRGAHAGEAGSYNNDIPVL